MVVVVVIVVVWLSVREREYGPWRRERPRG